MLIDQFIVGVAHDSVRKHILDIKKTGELTLDMCLQFARTQEATASQFGQFQSSSVASVKHTSKRSSHHKDSHKSSRSRRSRSKSPKKKSCVWSGDEQHDQADYLAADSQCSKCKKLGHWSQACLTTNTHKQNTAPGNISPSDNHNHNHVQWRIQRNTHDAVRTH